MYAKKNYEKYLLALKNSGLVSVEDKGLAGAPDSSAGAGTGALGLLGNFFSFLLVGCCFCLQMSDALHMLLRIVFCPVLY